MSWARLARAVYLVAAGAGLVWLFATRWDRIVDLVRQARPGWLLLALAASFGMLVLGAAIWHRVLNALAVSTGYSQILKATARSVLARYVPGSIWFAVGRIALLRRAGLPGGPLTVAATAEMILSIAVTISLGAAILGARGLLPGGMLWAVLAAVALAAIATPPLGGRLIALVAARQGTKTEPLSWAGYGQVLATVGAFWLWSAFTFTIYLRAFPAADAFATADVVGGFLFAWGVGFLALVAPQGIGVFEVTLAALLGTDDLTTTAFMIGGYRLVILVRDAIAAIAAEVTAARGDAATSAVPD